MASVRSALTATAIAALGAVFAFGPNVLEVGAATRQAEAAQRAAELATREARETVRTTAGPTRAATPKPATRVRTKRRGATDSARTSSMVRTSKSASPRSKACRLARTVSTIASGGPLVRSTRNGVTGGPWRCGMYSSGAGR